MSNAGCLVWLRDPRLAPLALSPLPAWAWSVDAARVIFANPTGAAIFGAATPSALARRAFDPGQPTAAAVARLAATLPADGTSRLEKLRGFGAGVGRALSCNCARVTLADGTDAILIAAAERAGPDLPLDERVHRLLTDADAPVAAFAADGTLIAAVPAAQAQLNGARTLAALGADALVAQASARGRAVGHSAAGALALDRIGSEPVLLATFGAPGAASGPSAPPALEPTERRHPLRFVWQLDADDRFTLDSDEFIALAGPATRAALGRTWEELAATLALDPEAQVARALAARDTWSGLTIAWPVDGGGAPLAVELSGLPVFDRERSFRGYRGFGVCRDVARLNALAQTREAAAAPPSAAPIAPASADEVEPVIDPPLHASAEPIGLTPLERTAFQEVARRLSGLTRTDIAADSESTLNDLVAAAMADPAAQAADGEQADLPAALAPAPDHTAALAELNAILDTATDGVIVLDRAMHIASANRSAQALFGSGAIAGQSFLDLFAPESVDVAVDAVDTLQAASGVPDPGREVIGRERSGGLIPLFMTIGRLDAGKLCAVFRDLTTWKKATEELLESKRAAEKQSSAKSDFLAKVSHEVRNPLNAIIGFSEVMMEERFGPIGNDRYRQYLKDIHASGQHIMSLVNDLLDLSKIEAGKLELTFTGVALNELVAQCVALMQPQANRERVIVRTSLAPRLPPVTADARSLRQIVLNLLSNSIKFTTAGGQVIVSTARGDAGRVVLHVRDTGIGMSEKDLATALEPFRQVATATRASAVGTGLGLPLSKALAEANRAHFRITSAPNEGTLVEVSFPTEPVVAE